jgi:electron transfer flavoprotein beta subunit
MAMNILVGIKRIPATGGKLSLTADGQEIDTRYLGFTISPHEECAVEEAIRLVETHGGEVTVLTLGPAPAEEQLRDAMALGVERAVLLETDGREWDPGATATAIVEAIQAGSIKYDLLLFGNEAADTGDYQVGIRVASLLDWPCLTGIKSLELKDGQVIAKREVSGGWEIYQAALPAVVTVKEGLNLPRYPSLPGRLKAKKKPIERRQPHWSGGGLEKMGLKLPFEQGSQVDLLGQGPAATARAIEILQKLGVMER